MPRWDLASARAASTLQEWIIAYLSEPEWENPGLLRRVHAYATVWHGPELVPLHPLLRIAGPGTSFRFPQDEKLWNEAIDRMLLRGVTPESLPPLILWKTDVGLNVADGNHRIDALRVSGYGEAWAILSPYPLSEEGLREWLEKSPHS